MKRIHLQAIYPDKAIESIKWHLSMIGKPADTTTIYHILDQLVRNNPNFHSDYDIEDTLDAFLFHSSLICSGVRPQYLSVTSFRGLMSSILGLREIYSKTYQRVWFDTPILRKPEWQSLQLLPESYADELEMAWSFMLKKLETPDNLFHGFKDYELQRLQRVIDWMKEVSKLDPDYVKMHKANFFKFFFEHDKRRNTNFENTFPEMIDFWKDCQYNAKTFG